MIANETYGGGVNPSYKERMKAAEKIGAKYLKIYQNLSNSFHREEEYFFNQLRRKDITEDDKAYIYSILDALDKNFNDDRIEKVMEPMKKDGYTITDWYGNNKGIVGFYFERKYKTSVEGYKGKVTSDWWYISTDTFKIIDAYDYE